jgi:hypothetical protein
VDEAGDAVQGVSALADAHPRLTALFTSAPILASSATTSSLSAKQIGQIAPSSRFAESLKPNVMYLSLKRCALRKKQTTLPSLAYAGIPYRSSARGLARWLDDRM